MSFSSSMRTLCRTKIRTTEQEGSRPVTCGARGVERRVRTPAKMFAFHAFVTRNSVGPLHVKQLLVVHPVTDSPSIS